jgi:LacI family transcriptional regulator
MGDKHWRVAVVLSTDMACYREILRGVNTFTTSNGNWTLDLYSANEDFVGKIRCGNPDGLIISAVNDQREAAAAVTAVDGLAVGVAGTFQDTDLTGLAQVESDDDKVGELAAAHLLSKGFTNFAFLGAPALWSDGRYAGFERALANAGIVPARLVHGSPPSRAGRGWPLPHYGQEIVDWLAPLPRPLAVFACNDLRGRELAELCRNAGLRVPDDIAILGVDNDDLECELSHPPLSSISVPWRRLGFEAARILDRLFRRRSARRTSKLLIPPAGVVERQSTDTTAIRDPDVSEAIRFIRQNAHRPIGVIDVLDAVPTARRSLEKRFRTSLGRSPLEEIRRAHVERAKHLLRSTDLPMPAVAEGSGFSSAAWLSKVFHDLAGETPTKYRQRLRCG